MESLGPHQFWGLSCALDLLEAHQNALKEGGVEDGRLEAGEYDFLLTEPGDVRHVLKTMAQRHRHAKDGETPSLNFYIHEGAIEQIARHLLLLSVAFDWSLPIRKRANVFLEIYGNALVQERTRRYIAAKRAELIQLVCDNKGPLSRLVDLSMLRFRQRDALVDTLRTYDLRVPFDMATLRDYRCRRHYGTRYDFRRNLMDWDLTMCLRPNFGNLQSREFREWRDRGVAFEFGDETYTMGNPSMGSYASGRARDGEKLVRGFWGDIVASPYHAFGSAISLPDKDEVGSKLHKHAADLLSVRSRHHGGEIFEHTATQLSVYSILALFWELETARHYVMRQEKQLYSGLGRELQTAKKEMEEAKKAKEKEEEGGGSGEGGGEEGGEAKVERSEEDRLRALRRAKVIAAALRGVKIKFLCGKLGDWLRRKKMEGSVDCMVASVRGVDAFKDENLDRVLRPQASLWCETPRNAVIMDDLRQREFERRALEMLATHCGARFVATDRTPSLLSTAHVVGASADTRPTGKVAEELAKRSKQCPGALPPPAPTTKERREVEADVSAATTHTPLLLFLRQAKSWPLLGGDNPRPQWLALVREADKVEQIKRDFETVKPAVDALALKTVKEEEEEEEEGGEGGEEGEGGDGGTEEGGTEMGDALVVGGAEEEEKEEEGDGEEEEEG